MTVEFVTDGPNGTGMPNDWWEAAKAFIDAKLEGGGGGA
jgi:hypothetical protein